MLYHVRHDSAVVTGPQRTARQRLRSRNALAHTHTHTQRVHRLCPQGGCRLRRLPALGLLRISCWSVRAALPPLRVQRLGPVGLARHRRRPSA